jgi:hypothetical protein
VSVAAYVYVSRNKLTVSDSPYSRPNVHVNDTAVSKPPERLETLSVAHLDMASRNCSSKCTNTLYRARRGTTELPVTILPRAANTPSKLLKRR